ncbi:MAG TPA: DUF4188 domain-containing protein [Polyangiaceae bacterium]|jgi:hypothetical protein
MATVIQKRVTGRMQGEFVVFLIGMRINRWWLLLRWLRVALAMPRMVRELSANAELGFLGAEQWFGRTTIMMSYWRSMDHLMAYAKSRSSEHLPAWRSFNRLVGTNGDVGIWHETYRVRPGDYENVYVNMAPFGLGKVGELVEASGSRAGAQGRLVAASA